jgi:hypothetical protein
MYMGDRLVMDGRKIQRKPCWNFAEKLPKALN